MNKSHIVAKVKSFMFKKYSMIDYYRKNGMKIGKNPRIFAIYIPLNHI